MVSVKRNYYKIHDYEYDSRRNFYWFKIIDGHFYEILNKLLRFRKIIHDYSNNIRKKNIKDFNHKDDKKIKIQKLQRFLLVLKIQKYF